MALEIFQRPEAIGALQTELPRKATDQGQREMERVAVTWLVLKAAVIFLSPEHRNRFTWTGLPWGGLWI